MQPASILNSVVFFRARDHFTYFVSRFTYYIYICCAPYTLHSSRRLVEGKITCQACTFATSPSTTSTYERLSHVPQSTVFNALFLSNDIRCVLLTATVIHHAHRDLAACLARVSSSGDRSIRHSQSL